MIPLRRWVWVWLFALAVVPSCGWAAIPASNSNMPAVAPKPEYTEQHWGIAIGLRYAEIPFTTASGDRSVTDVVPLMFFDDKHVYIHGLEGGIKLINTPQVKLNAILRYRWFDIPADIQNQVRGDAWDSGMQLRYRLGDWDLRGEFMGDGDARFYTDIGFDTSLGDRYAALYPYFGVRIKSADFNTKYYGFDQEYIKGGVALRANVEGRYHLVSNLYAIGRFGWTMLDDNARHSRFVVRGTTWNAYAGIAFFNNPDMPRHHGLHNQAYLRIAHGEATPSTLGQVLTAHKQDDPYHNQLTSLFYGYPLTDRLFGLPLDIYLTPGLVYHHHSAVQESFYEYDLAVKAFYTFNWSLRWRLGFGEGLSYSSQINYVERTALEAKGYRPSKVLNYLDLSVDINLGDVFHSDGLRNTWLGYGIHHRSGIFETSSQFGRIKGGSNYTTIYVQQHF